MIINPPGSAAPYPLVEGIPIRCYSGSLYFVGVARGSAICSTNAFDRMLGRLRNPFTINEAAYGNNAVSGMTASDVAAYAMGTPTIASAKNYPAVSAGTWTPTVLPTGVVILNCVANGALQDSTLMQRGTQNALDSLIRYFRAQSLLQDTAGAFVYTGAGWVSTANTFFPGGNHHHTTTQNDFATITTPAGTDFDLLIIGFDTASFNGSAYSVTVDGSAFTWPWNPGTTFGQASGTGSVWGANAPFAPIAIPLRNLSNQAHTIVLTKTGVTGGLLNVCQLLTPSPTPPTIIVQKMYYMPQAAPSATVDLYNSFIDSIVARFPNDNSVVVFDPNAMGWNPGSMISSLDGSHEHPNDSGMLFLTNTLTSIIGGLPAREGLQVPF